MLESGVQEYALSATPRLALTYYLDSTSYSPLEYCDDVYRNVWAKTLAGDENLDETDRALQNIYVEKLRQNVDEVKQIGKVRSLQTNAPDSVAFLSFGSGYGEPESMWKPITNGSTPACCAISAAKHKFVVFGGDSNETQYNFVVFEVDSNEKHFDFDVFKFAGTKKVIFLRSCEVACAALK